MEFRVLGPIEVMADGRRIPVTAGRQLALLAFLVAHVNRAVSADRIIDALWGDDPPYSGAKTVAFHVSRLRDALEPDRHRGSPSGVLATEPTGYVLRVEPERIDAVRFERLTTQGRAVLTTDPEAARAILAEALALWHGEPYADVADESFAQPEIRRLQELYLGALEDRLSADLATGRHAEVVDELEALVAEQPLRERLRGQLMIALYRAGRQAEALRTYGDGRRVLAEELGIDPGPELQQLEGWILRQDSRLDLPARRRAARNPYKGLRPFGERDSADFFGREALVRRLLERLAQVLRARRLLTVVGPSGSGKSSAVRAGLVPALRAGALPGSEDWQIAVMLPGARPFRELGAALRAIAPDAPTGLEERLERDGDLAGALATILPARSQALLIIDQFEELFTLVGDVGERARFGAAIAGALAATDGRLLVVATLRADFFSQPLLDPQLGELVRSGIEVVTPLTRDELEHAIVRPAESVGVQVEAGLATELIADLAHQPGELPLLQYTLTELFERSDGQRLTREGNASIGGVPGALGRRAEEVYAALDAEGREIARQAFLRLVAPTESGEPTARRVARSELRALSGEERRVDQALDAFGRGRLLSFDVDAVSGEPIVLVAHEALLTRWPRLAGWIDEARDDLWTRRRLADAATEWIRSDRDAGFLLSGGRLDLFAAWAPSASLHLDRPELDLLEASVAERCRLDEAAAARTVHERALERRATTQLRVLAVVLAVAALVATSLSVAVYGQGESAREQRAIAIGRELAAASIGNLGKDPSLSLLLAWHAADATTGRGYVVEEAMDALNWALESAHVAYPPGEVPIAVRASPNGPRGVRLVAPERLMDLAATAAARGLTPEECRTYLHRDACPAPPAAGGPPRSLDVSTTAGVMAPELLASASLAGTRVDVVWQLPADLGAVVGAFEGRTGIDIVGDADPGGILEARVAAEELPDLAIVSRPALVAELARAGLLVDLSATVDHAALRSVSGDYLVGLGTLGPEGTWPSGAGRLYGVPLAVEAKSQIWYPRAAFERAGYTVPRTWNELTALADRIVADGGTPWCLGLEAGGRSGGQAADFIDEILLHADGPDGYDHWASGTAPVAPTTPHGAFEQLGSHAFRDRFVLGGLGGAARTPEEIAGWPMFVDPPSCWLHLAGGAARRSWPAGKSAALAAFAFPAIDPAYADAVLGRALFVVVFHDRPEVRRLVDSLLEDEFPAEMVASLGSAGLLRLAPGGPTGLLDEAARLQAERVGRALDKGAFRVDATDLVPMTVATAIEQGTLHYLALGPISLSQVLDDIGRSWRASR